MPFVCLISMILVALFLPSGDDMMHCSHLEDCILKGYYLTTPFPLFSFVLKGISMNIVRRSPDFTPSDMALYRSVVQAGPVQR